MVQAILEGRKTQTRRILSNEAWVRTLSWFAGDLVSDPRNGMSNLYGYPGDRLWLRETWAKICRIGEQCEGTECPYCEYEYRADDPTARYAGMWPNFYGPKAVPMGAKWKPSIHMPREAARIILEVTDVRIERIQDISREDAIAEGVKRNHSGMYEWYDYQEELYYLPTPEESFKSLWKSIQGPESWELNPLVWVITFKRFEP